MRACITCCFEFDAAHRLPDHPGRCAGLHGHRYRVEVSVDGSVGDDGMVMDFDRVSELVSEQVTADFDHAYLNDLVENPTAELLAHEIWRRLSPHLPDLHRVRLWETATNYVDVVSQ